MANVQIKSEKLTPSGGIFPIMEQFDALLAQTIDSTLGMRCKWYGYQYSEILRSLMCVYLCGGSCVEDVTTHLMRHLSLHPSLRTCSADTILRAIKELTCENTTYQSASGRVYDFNTADKMNVYHQSNIPAIFQAVTHILKKRITIVFRAKTNLSAPHHLTCFLNIETWKHSPIVLIPFFHAGKDILYVPTKTQIVHLAAFI